MLGVNIWVSELSKALLNRASKAQVKKGGVGGRDVLLRKTKQSLHFKAYYQENEEMTTEWDKTCPNKIW